jgi:group I intron endonuclease
MIKHDKNIKCCGIYKITNPSGKIYIGQTIDVIKRIKYYKRMCCKQQIKLYNSFNKHGWEQHIFEIVEECNINQLNEREIYWGSYFNTLGENGLNLRLGNAKGVMSDESKQKISQSLMGKKVPSRYSKERNEKIQKANKGIKRSLEFCDKISKNKKGKSFKRKKVLYVNDNILFDSIKDCCSYFKTGYNGLKIRFKNKEIKLI